MTVSIATVAFEGAEARRVDVQVQITAGLPAFSIVGLADKAVAESRERVRAAFAAIGLALPPRRVVVNLAPADLPKEGAHYDLPIALGLMAAIGVLPEDAVNGYLALGELSLNGAIAPVAGVLPAAVAANAHDLGLICPAASGAEAAWAGGTDIIAAHSLMAIVNHMKGDQVLSPPLPGALLDAENDLDLRDVRGQDHAKRALEIAAAGGHNLLMVGPPGSGKSMLAERLPGVLPPLTAEELLEVSMVHSVAGLLERGEMRRRRPFRSPHHSASMAALVGGGVRAKPGEASLAHCGVLFLDELPEFHAQALDSLRQPLETGRISVARANAHITYPAAFQLIAAMNPCRCGWAGSATAACARANDCARRYQARLSGPLLDRFDLQIDVPAVAPADLAAPPSKEGSADISVRVLKAREAQMARGGLNVRLGQAALENAAAPDEQGAAFLSQAAETLGLTARGYHRVLRSARTIADLEGADAVRRRHIAEALSLRSAALGVGRPDRALATAKR
ncbi:MAG: YifB family Mg chelatase-like AAA ATPase [Maricaulaceae bacterium]